jgi:hypothetical protein
MDQRISPRREVVERVALVAGGLRDIGIIRNISEDGAMVKVEGPRGFSPEDIGARVELEALDADFSRDIPAAGKLVRIFEVDGVQYIALRFLDYLAPGGEGSGRERKTPG